MHYNRLTEFVNRFASKEEFNEVSNKAKEQLIPKLPESTEDCIIRMEDGTEHTIPLY
jgi:hypothetical protein